MKSSGGAYIQKFKHKAKITETVNLFLVAIYIFWLNFPFFSSLKFSRF